MSNKNFQPIRGHPFQCAETMNYQQVLIFTYSLIFFFCHFWMSKVRGRWGVQTSDKIKCLSSTTKIASHTVKRFIIYDTKIMILVHKKFFSTLFVHIQRCSGFPYARFSPNFKGLLLSTSLPPPFPPHNFFWRETKYFVKEKKRKNKKTKTKNYFRPHQTKPLFEPNEALMYVWNHYSCSLCGGVLTLFIAIFSYYLF